LESLIRSALPASASVRVASLVDVRGVGAQLVAESTPDMVLVGCSTNPEEALRVIAEMAGADSDSPIVALYEGNPHRGTRRQGAADQRLQGVPVRDDEEGEAVETHLRPPSDL
jgi:hypothetical protein